MASVDAWTTSSGVGVGAGPESQADSNRASVSNTTSVPFLWENRLNVFIPSSFMMLWSLGDARDLGTWQCPMPTDDAAH
jgi:hypothetical protein